MLQKAEMKVLLFSIKNDDELILAIVDGIAELEKIPDLMNEVFDAQEKAAKTTLDSSLKSLQVEREKLRLANLTSLLGPK